MGDFPSRTVAVLNLIRMLRVCLDTELMPWSAKAQDLLRLQYTAVSASARDSLATTVQVLQQAALSMPELQDLAERFATRAELVTDYVEAYRRYCWSVASIDNFKIAPF